MMDLNIPLVLVAARLCFTCFAFVYSCRMLRKERDFSQSKRELAECNYMNSVFKCTYIHVTYRYHDPASQNILAKKFPIPYSLFFWNNLPKTMPCIKRMGQIENAFAQCIWTHTCSYLYTLCTFCLLTLTALILF